MRTHRENTHREHTKNTETTHREHKNTETLTERTQRERTHKEHIENTESLCNILGPHEFPGKVTRTIPGKVMQQARNDSHEHRYSHSFLSESDRYE